MIRHNGLSQLFFGVACCMGITLALPAVSLPEGDLPANPHRPQDPTAEPDLWLDESRWGEERFGMTIRQPLGALVLQQTQDGANVRWITEDGIRVSLSIKRGVHYERDVGDQAAVRGEVHLQTVVVDTISALESVDRHVNLQADKWFEIGDKLAYLNYFMVHSQRPGEPPWFYGVGVVPLDRTSVVVLNVECPSQDLVESAVCTFECMLNSIEVEDIGDAMQRLRGWVDHGKAFADSVTPQARRAAMVDDQLLRIRENTITVNGEIALRDIGYLRVWQRHQDADHYDQLLADLQTENPDARLDGVDAFRITGSTLIIQSFYRTKDVEINQLREYIQADDDIREMWNIRTTLDQPFARYGQIDGAWAETGLRDMTTVDGTLTDVIRVIREGTPPRQMVDYVLEREQDPNRRLRFPSARPDAYPSGEQTTHSWLTPQSGYLSQVDAFLFPAMLPAEEKSYAFFAYHDGMTRIGLRVMHVTLSPQGHKIVTIRPTIDQAPEVMTFDANGKLIRWVFPDGRTMEHTTPEELDRLWN